jgi:hypothetical protein
MNLPELLDIYSKFHHLEHRGEKWSTSDWGCTCVHLLRDGVCSHAVIVSMLFELEFQVPETLEEAVPTACKLTLKRGIAGNKSKRYLAARAAETKSSSHKAKKFCPVGPIGTICLLFIVPCDCRA